MYQQEEEVILVLLSDYFEQSSDDIWSSVCVCVASIVADFPSKNEIRGIGFDATCSLVVVAEDGAGLR